MRGVFQLYCGIRIIITPPTNYSFPFWTSRVETGYWRSWLRSILVKKHINCYLTLLYRPLRHLREHKVAGFFLTPNIIIYGNSFSKSKAPTHSAPIQLCHLIRWIRSLLSMYRGPERLVPAGYHGLTTYLCFL